MRSAVRIISIVFLISITLANGACDKCSDNRPPQKQADASRPEVVVADAAIASFAEQLTRTAYPIGLTAEQVREKLGEPATELPLDNGSTQFVYGQKPDLSVENLMKKGMQIIGATVDFAGGMAVKYEWMVLSTIPSPESVKGKLTVLVQSAFGEESYKHRIDKSNKSGEDIYTHRVDFRSQTMQGFFEFSEMEKGVTSYRFQVKPLAE